MAIYGYTKNYKLIKPQFDTDTWHDYVYDNLDTIDAVLSAIFASGDWQGFWKSNTHYNVGGVVIDQATDTMYKVMVEHTTSEATFAAEQTAHPDYYELWSPNDLAESWATKTDGKVAYTDYSAKAYAVSSGLIEEGSAKEWASGSGAIGNTNEYSAKEYANNAHNDYISMTTNPNVVAVGSNINNVTAVGQSISNVNTVAGNVASVNTVAGSISDVTTVASVAGSVPTVANNSANVTTVANNISDVNTAATNIEAIKAATTAAANAAQSAANAANSATISANSAIWAEGTDAQVAALGGVHSSKGWAEQSTNANIALTNSPYTTNRILEIPQDIKLELNNGTLTLKAGSKVYVPNGAGVFDEKTTSSDLTWTGGWGNQQLFVYLDINNNIRIREVNITESGSSSSLTTQYSCWYDTTNNSIKWTDDTGSTWIEGFSFPIALITADASSIVSIDQIFNGFGYIGSTVFALPGVKVQIPNGRNTDGTCKSVYGTIRTVQQTSVNPSNGDFSIRIGDNYIAVGKFVYDEETNYNYNQTVSPSNIRYQTIAGTVSYLSGRITSFEPYTVDSVLNSSLSNLSAAGRATLNGKASIDLNNLSSTGEAHFANPDLSNLSAAGQAVIDGKADINLSNLTNGLANTICATPATATSTASSARPAVVVKNYKNGVNWYRVWSDGWIEQGGHVAQSTTDGGLVTVNFIKPFSSSSYYFNRSGIIGVNYSGAATGLFCCVNTKTSTYATFNTSSFNSGGVDWYACGY